MTEKSRIKIESVERSVQGEKVGFFQIDRITVRQRAEPQSEWSEAKDWEIVERRDSAAVIIYNVENDTVILTKQFRAPMLNRSIDNKPQLDVSELNDIADPKAFLLEAVAGVVREGETPEKTIKREAVEEVGYELQDLQDFGWFYPSPGGMSERIYLFYSEVSNENKISDGGGRNQSGEFIEPVEMPIADFFQLINDRAIHDSKIIMATDGLRDRIAERQAIDDRLGITYQLRSQSIKSKVCLRMRVGDIRQIHDVPLWVNSENTMMEMNQLVGTSISSTIRALGALTDGGQLKMDLVGDALRKLVHQRGVAKIGDVYETGPGELRNKINKVSRIYHLATVNGIVGTPTRINPADISHCVYNVLKYAHKHNQKWMQRWFLGAHKSILLPMIGTGNGGEPLDNVFAKMLEGILQFIEDYPDTKLIDINLLVYAPDDFRMLCRHLSSLPTFRLMPRARKLEL